MNRLVFILIVLGSCVVAAQELKPVVPPGPVAASVDLVMVAEPVQASVTLVELPEPMQSSVVIIEMAQPICASVALVDPGQEIKSDLYTIDVAAWMPFFEILDEVFHAPDPDSNAQRTGRDGARWNLRTRLLSEGFSPTALEETRAYHGRFNNK